MLIGVGGWTHWHALILDRWVLFEYLLSISGFKRATNGVVGFIYEDGVVA